MLLRVIKCQRVTRYCYSRFVLAREVGGDLVKATFNEPGMNRSRSETFDGTLWATVQVNGQARLAELQESWEVAERERIGKITEESNGQGLIWPLDKSLEEQEAEGAIPFVVVRIR